MNESQILAAIRKDLGREPDLVLWRLSQGGAMTRGGQTYRAGLSVNGASDLIGILSVLPLQAWIDGEPIGDAPLPSPTGRFFALEIKTPEHLTTIRNAIARNDLRKLKQSDRDQIMFLTLVRARGGFGAFADSQEAGRAALERARAGGSE